MPSAYKVLGQVAPPATTLTDLYVTPAMTQAVLSRLMVCNSSVTPTTFRISIAIAGAADASKQYIFWEQPIGWNETVSVELGIGLAATDKVRCFCALATVEFNLFGVELT